MNEILAFELIESLDKDGDSLINFEEYLKYIPNEEPQEKCHLFLYSLETYCELLSLQIRPNMNWKTKTSKLYLWVMKISRMKWRIEMSLSNQHLQVNGESSISLPTYFPLGTSGRKQILKTSTIKTAMGT